jgi:DNA-binding Lrp family transcriptional regulator
MTRTLDFRLLNDFQRGFPLVSAPFAAMGERLGVAEEAVMAALCRLQQEGGVSRVGPVFAPGRLGASTLAALAVPASHLEDVAALISARPEVNHNYLREHRYNLWFVAAAADRVRLGEVLDDIGRETGCRVISLPLVDEYHIDLGFDLAGGAKHMAAYVPRAGESACALPNHQSREATHDASLARLRERGGGVRENGHGAGLHDIDSYRHARSFQDKLVAALQGGLEVVAHPFKKVAEAAGLSEDMALSMIGEMLDSGIIKRFGVVVRHHELGYRANAMCVWDVPDGEVAALGTRLAAEPAVTLCYRRQRALPGWPYNLFCMIHGRERAEVESERAAIAARHGLDGFDHEILFSLRRFKQCGARYAATNTRDLPLGPPMKVLVNQPLTPSPSPSRGEGSVVSRRSRLSR